MLAILNDTLPSPAHLAHEIDVQSILLHLLTAFIACTYNGYCSFSFLYLYIGFLLYHFMCTVNLCAVLEWVTGGSYVQFGFMKSDKMILSN